MKSQKKKNTLMKRNTDEEGRADVLFTKVRQIKSKQKGNIRRDSLRSEAPARERETLNSKVKQEERRVKVLDHPKKRS